MLAVEVPGLLIFIAPGALAVIAGAIGTYWRWRTRRGDDS